MFFEAAMEVIKRFGFFDSLIPISYKLLQVSNKLSNAVFMEKCINFIEENAVECVKSNAFLNCKKDTLIKVISSDDFAMDEADVFRF